MLHTRCFGYSWLPCSALPCLLRTQDDRTMSRRCTLVGRGKALFLLASKTSDGGVRLPYSELAPSTATAPSPSSSPGPLSDWLRTLSSSCECGRPLAAFKGLREALAMPLHEALITLFGKAEQVLMHAICNLQGSEWSDWLKIPLVGAASQGDFEAVSALLRAGAGGRDRGIGAWMVPGGDGRTLLHSAADGGDARVVEALLANGAGVVVNAVAGGGFSPFHVAAMRGREEASMALARAGAAVHRKAPYKQSALHLAAGAGHAGMISALVLDLRVALEGGDDIGATPLHTAAWHGKADCVRALLDLGAEVDARDKCGRPALFQAIRWGGQAGLEAMRELLHAGAKVRTSSDDGDTPLHVACRYGRVDAVRLLLRHDADERARCDLKKTPEDVARQAEKRSEFSADAAREIYAALETAPAGRAWRRRGWLVMLRARSVKLDGELMAKEGGAGGGFPSLGAAGAAAQAPSTAEEAEDAASLEEFFTSLRKALGDDEERPNVSELDEELLGVGAEEEDDDLLERSGGEPLRQQCGDGGDAQKACEWELDFPRDKRVLESPLYGFADVPSSSFDLQATCDDLLKEDMCAGFFSAADQSDNPCKRRRASLESQGLALAGAGNEESSFHDLVARTLEMADGPFEIIGSYL